jgi:hypothetical protein
VIAEETHLDGWNALSFRDYVDVLASALTVLADERLGEQV